MYNQNELAERKTKDLVLAATRITVPERDVAARGSPERDLESPLQGALCQRGITPL